MKILVLGGAGYIGSHAVRSILASGSEAIVADSLETGHTAAVDGGAKLYVGDIRDGAFLDNVLGSERVDAVMHFAANSRVGESMEHPIKYYDNNMGGAISLVKAMAAHNVKRIIFSSTAAVYGQPSAVPISEEAPTNPENPYGETKLAMERLFKWAGMAHGINYVSLRYFNACGADETGDIGEDHSPETHLIPIILQVPLKKREYVSIFGTDYDTRDGSCVRDYVHVSDLISAHMLALQYLNGGGASGIFNLGNGVGYTVREVIETARRVTGHPIPAREEARRAGDPAELVAASGKAASVLGWKAEHGSLTGIIRSAWKWHSAHPDGYGAEGAL